MRTAQIILGLAWYAVIIAAVVSADEGYQHFSTACIVLAFCILGVMGLIALDMERKNHEG
jgi:hypothetical protein